MKSRTALTGWLLLWFSSCGFSQAAAAEAPVFFDLRPGTTARAEVDLQLGEPTRKTDGPAYEYRPPRGAPEVDHVLVSYFADTWQVARIEVWFKTPMPADPLREQFGTRILKRERSAAESEELYYPRMQSLITKGDEAAAIGYLSPRWLADFYADRSREHLSARRLDEARVAADKSVIIAPDYARAYVAQGIYYWTLKDYAEAKVRFSAGVGAASAPASRALAHLWLGHLYANQEKRPQEAEAEYGKAIAESPSLAEAHLRYGIFLADQKRLKDAAQALKKAVELDPKSIEAHRRLADVARDQRDWAEEFTQLKALHEWVETPANTDSELKGKILRRYAEALWPGREATERQAFGKPEQALQVYEQATRADSRDTGAFFSVAAIHRELGEPLKAVDCYRSGLQRDPKSFTLQRGLGMALIEAGRYVEARQVAEESIPLDPKNSAAQMAQVARAWSAKGDKKHALVWLRKAVAAGYNDRQYLNSDRYFAPLRNDGEFKKIVARMS